MSFQIEVCIDNLESLHNALQGGATRIELCSSLALGGLTPSFGFMKKAAQLSTVPVYAMIRPRQGDFLYDSDDIEAMLEDIAAAKKAGLAGVVFGVLKPNGDIDMDIAKQLMIASQGLGTTFHRAIDQCSDYRQAIENVAELGCERILTSGLAANAAEGKAVIAEMVKLANGRFSIMAGAGVTVDNANEIITVTGIHEIHLSGKSTRASHMNFTGDTAKMGTDNLDDFIVPVTNSELIRKVKNLTTP